MPKDETIDFDDPAKLAAQFVDDFGRGSVLLALDFDGTLAELEDDPAKSHLVPASQRALESFAELTEGTPHRLALVSGRDLETLSTLAAAPAGTVLIGSHGAERGLLGSQGLELVGGARTAAEEALWQELRSALSGIAARAEGAWVEEKTYAVVLHTRLVTTSDPEHSAPALLEHSAAALLAAGQEAAAQLGITALLGKNVVEAPLRQADKGTALQELRAELGSHTVLYAGDDVTDEHAFTALKPTDFTVKVGTGATAARFRLANPAAVGELLDQTQSLLRAESS